MFFVISGDVLQSLLEQAHQGADPDLVILELLANSEYHPADCQCPGCRDVDD